LSERGDGMILGIGTDIVEIDRVRKALERAGFAERVFTAAEREYCEGRGAQRWASFAARFAGKEAVLKAFGTGLSAGSWQDVEILPDAAGRPTVGLKGHFAALAAAMGVAEVHVSLSHARDYATAQAVLWGGDGR
jgi:holo-[acyl-carrier protein] synthase